jgi:integrase
MPEILEKANHQLFNPANERIIYKYLAFRSSVKGNDKKTCLAIHKAIRSYEVLTDFANFKCFSIDLANAVKLKLSSIATTESYLLRILKDIRDFLQWLSHEDGYSCIKYNEVEYLNLTKNQLKAARAQEYQESYTYPTIFKVIRQMPVQTILERRNKAIISLQALASLREEELRTIKIKNLHYDETNNIYFIYVTPKDMKNVKFSKQRENTILNLAQDVLDNIISFRDELINKEHFTEVDCLFPKINQKFNQRNMLETLIEKSPMCSTTIRNIFKQAFVGAGEKYCRIHSFRHTRAKYITRTGNSNFVQAMSQDFGHTDIKTTMQSYAVFTPEDRRAELAKVKMD